jgi:hypothetical protein
MQDKTVLIVDSANRPGTLVEVRWQLQLLGKTLQENFNRSPQLLVCTFEWLEKLQATSAVEVFMLQGAPAEQFALLLPLLMRPGGAVSH